jgi:hypothetical protein
MTHKRRAKPEILKTITVCPLPSLIYLPADIDGEKNARVSI